MTSPTEGQQAPNFTATDAHGAPHTLASLAGTYTVLYFYPKDATPGCTVEARDFQVLLPQFKALNTQIVGVSRDSAASHQKFCANEGLTFLLLSDTDGNVCKGFGCWVEKKNYGKTYMGIQRSTFLLSPSGKILQLWRNVKVEGHAQKVLDVVTQYAQQAEAAQ